MVLTLQAVLAMPFDSPNVRIEITDEAADRAWEISQSASPHHAFLLLVRFGFLMNSRRLEELRPIADELQRHTDRVEVREALEQWRSLQ